MSAEELEYVFVASWSLYDCKGVSLQWDVWWDVVWRDVVWRNHHVCVLCADDVQRMTQLLQSVGF